MTPSRHPTLFATFGFPGSGKTHFASRFADQFQVLHLNSDRVRLLITVKPEFTAEEHGRVFRLMDYVAMEAITRGQSVIYDANFNKRSHRRRIRRLAEEAGGRYLGVHVVTPDVLAWDRLQRRADRAPVHLKAFYPRVPRQDFERIMTGLERPDHDEPFVVINGTAPYEEQAKTVLRWFRTNGHG